MELKDIQAELTAMETKLKDVTASKEEVTELKTEIEALSTKLSENKFEAKDDETIVSMNQKIEMLFSQKEEAKEPISLVEALEEKNEAIKAMVNGGKDVEIEAGLLQRSSVTNNTKGSELPGIGQIATKKLSFRGLFAANTFTDVDDNGTIKYIDWDEDSIARGAAAVAEGGTFPASSAAFEMYTAKYKKAGDSINMTEEVLEDSALIAREMANFLQTNVEQKENADLINGDGTGANLLGIVAQVPAYVPEAAGIQDANIGDLVVKVKESITKTGGAKYNPDFVLMNISDINKYKLKKDANNNYLLPNSLLGGEMNIDGINVVEDNDVTANTMILGDRAYGRIYDKSGYVLSSTNSHESEFLEDKITLKGRKRSLFLIRQADKDGFAKVTSISAALTTIGS